MKKTKIVSLILALIMAFSLAIPAAAASDKTYPTPGTTYGGNPYDPVILTDGTVLVEDKVGLIRVFLDGQVVVTMSEQFMLDYTSTATTTNRGFTSKYGYAWLAEQTADRLIREKLVTRADDGKSLAYGDKVIHLSTAGSSAMELEYLVKNHFRQPVTEIRTLDTVSYTLTYRNGKASTSTISVQTYGDTIPSISAYRSIWAVRELDDYTIEVYLRNGMVVTLNKSMIVDWVDARQRLGSTFKLDSWHDRYEMDDEGARTCVDFCQELLDELIIQGWTVFPAAALEPGYSYRKFDVRDVMAKDVTMDRVLVRSLERLRTEDTTSDVTIYFDYYDWNGRLYNTVECPMSFEFLYRDTNTASGFGFYQLTRPEYFRWAYNTAQDFWLTDDDLRAIEW